MNSDQTMQMPSGPPPPSQRVTCGEFSGDRESYGAAASLGYGGIPTSSTSSYGSFGVLSSLSSGGTGTSTLPLLLSTPPSTSTFKTTPISMPTSTPSPSSLIPIPMSTPAPSPLIPMTNPTTTTTPPPSTLLPMSMSMSLTTPTQLPTQLLPMPTLEDIEVATQQQPSAPPQSQPTGILKYPTASSIGYVSELLPPPGPALASSASSSINSNCGTLKSNAKLLPLQLVANAAPTRKEPPSSAPTAQSQQQQRQRRQGWCACFGSGPSASEAKTPHGYGSKTKKRKQTAQTVWSALLTNLGICMLLLAYTLLGSFIFLTIENEDSALLHQQHTLASTKRNMASNSHSNTNGNGNGIYQQQRSPQTQPQQQRQQQGQQQGPHTDNDTMAAAIAQGQDLGHERSVYGQASNDFVYGLDDSDMEAGQAQFALSPDTYDVRQRTIENIWDITVSLNILYKENWTKLAALEIAKFQDQLIKRLNEDVMLQLSHDDVAGGHSVAGGSAGGAGSAGGSANNPATEAVLLHTHFHHHRLAGGGVGGPPHEWNFAKAFLYSLTVLTTIGYGNIAPRTALGRIVTLAYAFFGIPLTLVYLSSTGSILAKVAREVFSKALCCCLCSNCGYCCYDEKRMAEKERRMKRKRQQEELRKQQAVMQEPYYVRDVYHATPEKQAGGTVGGAGGGVGGTGTAGVGGTGAPTGVPGLGMPPAPPSGGASGADIDSLSASESRGSMHGLSILAPILLCFSMMIIYIVFGAAVLYRLENWPIIDGIYFCFMSLSTIGFGDMLPGLRRDSNATTWFCSVYIMSGMTLTAMCFNVIHEEIVHRIRIVVEFKKAGAATAAGTGGSMLDVTHEEGNQYYVPAS
ncbi:uncharacterized protein [Drosophila virilis]|uniref:Potassium channel domain-containing protein n=1 Tax=Drosophila virilis TaxID=7244 RepID=B4M3H8_DROVI|nr:uncharacterized protein LOC26530364 [Drosophila virilis]EDW65353.2 uncharacterized protein Dvir_GJ18952 [Drosophila virilis]